jgi:hypothetical protein
MDNLRLELAQTVATIGVTATLHQLGKETDAAIKQLEGSARAEDPRGVWTAAVRLEKAARRYRTLLDIAVEGGMPQTELDGYIKSADWMLGIAARAQAGVQQRYPWAVGQ